MSKLKLSDEIKKKIDAVKSNGHSVYHIEIEGHTYVYRSINRQEYRALQRKMADAGREAEDDVALAALKDDGEEELVTMAMIWPEVQSRLDISAATKIAGAVTTVSDKIMQASGFGVDAEPQQL